MKTQIEFVNEDAKRLYEGKLEYKTEKSAGFDLMACSFIDNITNEKIANTIWRRSIANNVRKKEEWIFALHNGENGDGLEHLELQPQGVIKIGTGIKISPPEGYATFVYPRSSVATKNEIILLNSVGIIDNDYRGEMIVCLKNISDKPFKITLGERIAQAVIQPVLQSDFEYVDKLDTTQRGKGGFGSTGK
jgi:dUTP pyrophosphatase